MPNATARTIYGIRIDLILSSFDGIALCQIGSELVHVHETKIIR